MTMIVCVQCGVNQPVRRVTMPSGNRSRWVGIDGRQWNGSVCSNCKYSTNKSAIPLLKRSCNQCKVELPSTHRFNCHKCLKHMSHRDIEDEYGVA